jgi:arabinofuranan 3-O-arabinosyltransferase
MRASRREVGIPLLLAAAAFALAFAQRPGLATADTKINLHVDPGGFLAQAASMWTSTGQLGDVQAGQQAGYLFPMGPFFALGHAIGLSDWIVQRLWLGSVLALAAWGVVRLLDVLLERPRGIAHLTAGAVTLLNPFVVTYANRTTVTLLAYAALPWLMLAVHRGLRDARGWRWPAAFALLVTASGGGVNGAVTAWMLLGPVLLLLYELLFTRVGRRAGWAFVLRAAPLTLLASVWWVVPAYVQSSYGINFLHFTEQPGTIWGTTSATESLRLMSFWLSYVGIGFSGTAIPYFDDSRTMLFSAPVVLGTLLLPAGALSGFVWTRRWRHGPFFLGLALVAVVVMMAGFPEGTPLRHGLNFTYNHVAAVQFLRASYKAAPLLAIALACLAGGAAGEAWQRMGGRKSSGAWRAGAAVAGLLVLVLAAWPLVSGRAQDAQVSYTRIPSAWRQTAVALDRELPPNSRAIVLPGDLFSFYSWGGTVDPILPALSRRPVAERSEVPYADLRATDLLWTIDGLVHQQRLLPGQLAPLLGLIGVRQVVTGTDDDLARSGAPAPADVAAELATQVGFAHSARSYGPRHSFTPTGIGPAIRLAQVRRYDLPPGRGLVRLEPRDAPVVVDGSAGALAGLAAFGALPARSALLYSGDLAAAGVRAQLAAGGTLVISDSNRRRAFVVGSLEQNTGPTLTANQNVSADGLILDPFGRGPDFETVALFTGIRSVEAPASPERVQFPEHAPFAAIDGSAQTAWVADPTLAPSQRWLQVDFERARDVPFVELDPYDDAGGTVRQVQIGGHLFAVHPGWNRLTLGLRAVSSLRVTLTRVSAAQPGAAAGAGGITELRIPGVHASEQLRLPVDAAGAVAGSDLTRVALTYLFERTTGDDPYERDLAHGSYSAFNVHDTGDAELAMRRQFEPPARRRFAASAWVTPAPQTPDDTLDRLAGYRGAVDATSSSRFDSEPRWRASSALDGNPATAWIGDYDPSAPAWLRWRSPRPMSVRVLVLSLPVQPVRRPSLVRLLWPGGSTAPLPVTAGGRVTLAHTVTARQFRIEILRASAPGGASLADRRAVGIAEIGGVSGLPRVAAPRRGAFAAPCGSAALSVGAGTLALSVSGSAAAFADGSPLLAQSCATIALRAGTEQLAVAPGPFAIDELELTSPALRAPAVTGAAGRVLDPGTAGSGSYDHVRVTVSAPAWLVLGESYNRGWRAWCNGREQGAPVPIDGYANGWPVGPGCRQVRFAFTPNRLAAIGYLVSGVAGLLCLALLIVGAGGGLLRRGRRPGAPGVRAPAAVVPARAPIPASAGPAPAPAVRAVILALAAGAAFGFVFGLWAGAVSVPVIAWALWRGTGARVLTLWAGGLLGLVVPVLYLAHPGDERGGNHFGYAAAHLAAHWVGVAALGLLIGALWRALRQPDFSEARFTSGPAAIDRPDTAAHRP